MNAVFLWSSGSCVGFRASRLAIGDFAHLRFDQLAVSPAFLRCICFGGLQRALKSLCQSDPQFGYAPSQQKKKYMRVLLFCDLSLEFNAHTHTGNTLSTIDLN